MKLTIIKTGRPPGPLATVFPAYPAMFESLISNVSERFAFETLSVVDGAPLPDPSALEAVLITGSPRGVYDDDPWIAPLRAFIRSAAAKGLPMIGVCFGHQIIADALGGEVRKSEKGWGVGRHAYRITSRREWMSDAGDVLSLAVSHQDQVITPPEGADTLACNDHTPHAVLEYRFAPILTLQGHPEFSDTFAAALYNARRGGALTDDQVDAAVDSLSQPNDNELAAEWIVNFLAKARAV